MTVLVTGAGGSFGATLVRELLEKLDPGEVRAFIRSESRQVAMQQRLADSRVTYSLGDIRDETSLARAMVGVDIVIHAAAMKHVPLCELHPLEAVRTNIEGTVNVVKRAIQAGVKLVVGISTDKAVQPVSLYGATKLVCERILLGAAAYDPRGQARFMCLRMGNLAGSAGSVVEMFRSQSRQGMIRITHRNMTRFLISLEEAARFALASISRRETGVVLVPKMPSIRIVDLAEAVAPGVPKTFIGPRPGEKMHEVLIARVESMRAMEYSSHYVLNGALGSRGNGEGRKGANGSEFHVGRPRAFQYSSHTNPWWLTGEELAGFVKETCPESL